MATGWNKTTLDVSDKRPERDLTPGTVTMEFAARAEHLIDVRRAVSEAAIQAGLARYALDDLLTAVDEAVANAIRHGSPRGDRDRVTVKIIAKRQKLTVSVQDSGTGFMPGSGVPAMPDPDALGGRGLPLMAALADSLEITSTDHGSIIVLNKHLV